MSDPLASVFLFCKDCRPRFDYLRRSVESVLAQSYRHIEYIVQDGASTDGTTELLGSFGPRLSLVSEPDAGSDDGFWRALRRCRGEYICCCLSDEELLPDAMTFAVRHLERHPDVGAVFRDVECTDLLGRTTSQFNGRPFDLFDYMSMSFTPCFSATVFRRAALEQLGVFSKDWRLDCGEYELWCRLGMRFPIDYQPGTSLRFAVHGAQRSNDPDVTLALYAHRVRIIDQLVSQEGVFGGCPVTQLVCKTLLANKLGVHLLGWNHHGAAQKLFGDSEAFGRAAYELLAEQRLGTS
jgi:GT2 family glycosyltransferase